MHANFHESTRAALLVTLLLLASPSSSPSSRYHGVVGKEVSVGSGRRPRLGSNPTTYRFEAMPFVEWFKVTYMSL
ncbi:hypothetical protein E2C01_097302 [Portunus trituberculatus]|uniref:Secreted protein n=1 Tax=Portunus trituberculatus TaxID=210409 RepID=A0A5B7K9L4_PORTR|nr:hypothetical protein [Portunus trituberculatus]